MISHATGGFAHSARPQVENDRIRRIYSCERTYHSGDGALLHVDSLDRSLLQPIRQSARKVNVPFGFSATPD